MVKKEKEEEKKERKNIGLPSQFKSRTGRIVDPCHQIQLNINNETGWKHSTDIWLHGSLITNMKFQWL